LQGRDRHAAIPDLAAGARVVRVQAHQGRQVEGHAEAGLSVLEQILEAPVSVFRRPETGELAHCPEPTAVHGWIDAAGVGELAGPPEVRLRIPTLQVIRRIQTRNLKTGEGCEACLALVHRNLPPTLPLEGESKVGVSRIGVEPSAGLTAQPARLHVLAKERAGPELGIAQ